MIQQQIMQDRQITIVDMLTHGKTHEQISRELGLSRTTVERSISAFVNSEQFTTWLKQEWLRLHSIMLDKEPKEAYRALSQLIKRGGIEVTMLQKDNITGIRIVFGDSLPVSVSKDIKAIE